MGWLATRRTNSGLRCGLVAFRYCWIDGGTACLCGQILSFEQRGNGQSQPEMLLGQGAITQISGIFLPINCADIRLVLARYQGNQCFK